MTYEKWLSRKCIPKLDSSGASSLREAVRFFSNDETITVLPADEPVKGLKGFVIWRINEEDEEEVANPLFRVAEEAQIVNVENKEEFNNIFSDAWERNYPITQCDDPVKRLFGFIVTKRTNRTLYRISLTKYKET